MQVVLPDPDSPTRPRLPPSGAANATSSSASRPPRYLLVTPSKPITNSPLRRQRRPLAPTPRLLTGPDGGTRPDGSLRWVQGADPIRRTPASLAGTAVRTGSQRAHPPVPEAHQGSGTAAFLPPLRASRAWSAAAPAYTGELGHQRSAQPAPARRSGPRTSRPPNRPAPRQHPCHE